mmetsp:Transcript_87743/g.261675  ORF Transcript_87743/g.261675 Transcript_87743/m.261675 type:complete len:201 (-) Transcript_87743:340-942(-)
MVMWLACRETPAVPRRGPPHRARLLGHRRGARRVQCPIPALLRAGRRRRRRCPESRPRLNHPALQNGSSPPRSRAGRRLLRGPQIAREFACRTLDSAHFAQMRVMGARPQMLPAGFDFTRCTTSRPMPFQLCGGRAGRRLPGAAPEVFLAPWRFQAARKPAREVARIAFMSLAARTGVVRSEGACPPSPSRKPWTGARKR